jgi:ubiquinone/menaquinone biosynthesis C-methylase UbiE
MHPFPTGRQFAESIGYTTDALNGIPDECIAAFAGVSNISMTAQIPPGSVVLDLGCGSGIDSLVAARRAGPSGRVIGIDFSAAMLARARDSLAKTGIGNVTFKQADAESLPLADASVDIALANGIFNLNPPREVIFRELARVVRPGGSVYAAELILTGPVPEALHAPSDWFA